jgi:hypothetical protein
MGHFKRFLNDLELMELHHSGRLFTWSNERVHPTLERIDISLGVMSGCTQHWSALTGCLCLMIGRHRFPAPSSRPCLRDALIMLRCCCSLMMGLIPSDSSAFRIFGRGLRVTSRM